MTEALATAPNRKEIGLIPNLYVPQKDTPQELLSLSDYLNPRIFELPDHLKRETLRNRVKAEKSIPQSFWNERGRKVEEKVKDTLSSQEQLVLSVLPNSREDADGPDYHLFLNPEFPIKDVWIEVKSSSITVGDYKDKIKSMLAEGKKDPQHVQKWMTERRLILINGGESHGQEKTPFEILVDSFYPQLFRIVESEYSGLNEELVYGSFYPHVEEIKLLSKQREEEAKLKRTKKPIQVFPAAVA